MILLECDNDEALVRGLGITRSLISHHAGKPRVAKALRLSRIPNSIGLVDQDPGATPPPYLQQFSMVDDERSLGLKRLKHRTENKWLIEIQPDLEPWLYRMASIAQVRASDFHLPLKHSDVHANPKAYAKRIIEFVAEILNRQSPALLKLHQWLNQR